MGKAMLAACLAILLLAGCGGRSAPKYPADEAVLQVAHGGGFQMIDMASEMIPDVTIWGDGRTVFVRRGRAYGCAHGLLHHQHRPGVAERLGLRP